MPADARRRPLMDAEIFVHADCCLTSAQLNEGRGSEDAQALTAAVSNDAAEVKWCADAQCVMTC